MYARWENDKKKLKFNPPKPQNPKKMKRLFRYGLLNLDGGLKRDVKMRQKLPKAIENYLSPKEKILATHSISQISRAVSPRQPMYYATDKKIIRVIDRGRIRKPEIDSVLYEDVTSIEKVPGRILKDSVIMGLFCFIVASWGMIFWEKWDIFHSGFLLFSCILLFVFGIVFTLVGFAEKRRSCYQITAANQKKWLVRDVTLPTALEFIRVIEEKTSRR